MTANEDLPYFKTVGGVTVIGVGSPWRPTPRAPWKLECKKLSGGAHGHLNIKGLKPLNQAARALLLEKPRD